MNFKKYHVSKNLLDYTTVESTTNATATQISGGISVSGRYYVRFRTVEFTVGSTYTMSWKANTIGGASAPAWRFHYADNTYSSMPSSRGSLVVEKEVSELLLYVSTAESCVVDFTEIMLNTGSTPLPYEPYSSEVWHDIPHYIHNTSTDTITTLPADIYANDTTATVGLKGNTTQSGTPTPDNPIMPQGTGDKTANLFDGSIEQGTLNENAAIGTSYNNTKSIPTAAINPYRVRVTNPIYIDRELTFSIDFNSYQMYVLFFDENQKYTGSHSSSWRNSPLTLSGEYIGKYIGLVVKSKQSGNVPISPTDDIKLMLSSGSTALPYDKFGYKIPISSANTTTPVYLGEVETTRKVKKFVLTGSEGGVWTKNATIRNGNGFYNLNIFTGYKPNVGAGYCTHYPLATAITDTIGVFFGGNINFITDFAEGIDTADKWKTYLQQQYAAGTPVTIWYVLATPETAVVNEPLMRIGGYADTLSNVSIPVTAGGDTISVGTTLQPSEVTVNYKGWHTGAVHERESGAWD